MTISHVDQVFAAASANGAVHDHDNPRSRLEDAITRHGIVKAIADILCETDHFARDGSDKLYYYHGGVYRRHGERFIEQRVKAVLTQAGFAGKWNTHRASEVVAYIRVDAPELFETPPLDTLNCRNGLLDVATHTLAAHTPAFLSATQLPITYDPEASAHAWEAFEADILPPDCAGLLFRLAAWLMLPHKHIQKAVLLLGEGGNGKSTLLNALRAFLGKVNTASVSLQRLEAQRFAVVRLLGKLVNICPDLPSSYLETTSTFKALTGFNDTVEGERKHIQDSIEFDPYCRLLFSANRPPRSGDDSQGFFDRWLVVPCEAQFRGTNREKPSDTMAATLAAPAALSGALNKALTYLPSIRQTGFPPTESTQRAFTEFREATDPLVTWLDRHTIIAANTFVAKDELVGAYNRDCERRNRAGVTKTAFTQALKRQRPMVSEDKGMVNGVRVPVYKGLAWKVRREHEE